MSPTNTDTTRNKSNSSSNINNLRNTTLLLLFLILAFFPSAFQYILHPILAPFGLSSTPPATLLPTCACCPPLACPTPQIITTTTNTATTMSWTQKEISLPSRSRGAYLITNDLTNALPELASYKTGLLHVFLQHTSAGLSLNENWDAEVREDMSDALDRLAPEDRKGDLYRHDAEGLDDMPAHIKSALVGASVTVPITDGRLNLGTWQGVWFLEFRRSKHTRRVVATIQGEKKK